MGQICIGQEEQLELQDNGRNVQLQDKIQNQNLNTDQVKTKQEIKDGKLTTKTNNQLQNLINQDKMSQNNTQELINDLKNYPIILKGQSVRNQIIITNQSNPLKREHFYANQLTKGVSNPNKTKRLNGELIQLKRNLPINESNSIFICYDNGRLDVMKSIITGSDKTPYQNGIFLFDCYFDESFPIKPPKVTLMTNGGQTIRFNPNLYTNGYVCLSLLGTWRGDSVESWSPATTLNSILVSIQSMVMSENVYFNEPGYENLQNDTKSQHLNQGYCNIVKYGTIKYAMTDMINNPPPQFSDIIKVHFYLKQQQIIEQVEQWIQEAKQIPQQAMPALYIGLVQDHNPKLSAQFKNNKIFVDLMIKEFNNLKIALNSIQQEQVLQILNKWNNQ